MVWIQMAGFILLGWGIGILINYLSDVLPATRRLTAPACAICSRPILTVDYLLLRACQECGARRKWRAWVVQTAAVLVTVWLGLVPDGRLGFWASLTILSYFGVVAVIDIEHRLIMHPVSLLGVLLGGGIGLWLHGWQATLLGGLAGFAIMLGIYFLGFLFTKWLARVRKMDIEEEALGFGDVALSGILGLLLGWPGVAGGIILAILLGGAGSLVILVYSLFTRKYRTLMAIPYGPFMLSAATLLLFRVIG